VREGLITDSRRRGRKRRSTKLRTAVKREKRKRPMRLFFEIRGFPFLRSRFIRITAGGGGGLLERRKNSQNRKEKRSRCQERGGGGGVRFGWLTPLDSFFHLGTWGRFSFWGKGSKSSIMPSQEESDHGIDYIEDPVTWFENFLEERGP